MAHNGWRKPTPGLIEAESHARAGERLAVPKSQAIAAIKKIAAAIGLKAQDLLLIDTFGAITQPQDWGEGRRPIVWASNNFLMEQTGFSLPTLRRHVRRLCDAGVIWMKDSPNGKRWGRRDDEGHIVEAFGFDLAPLAARTGEFEALYDALQEERAFCARLRKTITITRRTIRAKIERAIETGLKGPWREFREEYGLLLELLPKPSADPSRLMEITDRFQTFRQKVEEAFAAAFDWPETSDAQHTERAPEIKGSSVKLSQNMKPTHVEKDTHILTTNQLISVNRNSFEKSQPENAVPESGYPGEGDTYLGHQPDPDLRTRDAELDMDFDWDNRSRSTGAELDIPLLMASCPQFAANARDLHGYLKTWQDVHRAAATLRAIIGISEDAWHTANTVLGAGPAAVSIALIYDKYEDGLVKSPGGYLRGMVERAQNGELHLDRSIFGRLREPVSAATGAV